MLFFHILGRLIPTDELIFFSVVQTTNQYISIYYIYHKLELLELPTWPTNRGTASYRCGFIPKAQLGFGDFSEAAP